MPKTISEMSRDELIAAYRYVLDLATAGSRELTADEQKLCDAYEARLDAMPKGGGLQRAGDTPGIAKAPSKFAYLDERSGHWVRDVGRGESLASSAGLKDDAPSLGGMIIGSLTGRWNGLPREQAVVEKNDTQGGFVVGSATSANVIDRARAAMVMDAAGMRTIPFPDGVNEFGLARVETDPTSYWRHEGVAITSSNPAFGKIWLRPKTLGCLVPVSIEFLEDVRNGQQMIEDIITRSMARGLDEAIIRGTGNAGPTGISNTSDIETTAVNGTWSYDTLLDGLKLCWENNSPTMPSAVLLSVASELRRKKMKDGDGKYLTEHPLAAVPFLMTTAIPDTLGAGAATELYTGDFTRVLLAVKTQMKVEVLPAGTADSINATSQMYRWIRVYLRADCHIEQPGHIWVGTGVTN